MCNFTSDQFDVLLLETNFPLCCVAFLYSWYGDSETICFSMIHVTGL